MNMPLAGIHIGDMTRQYVARIGSIYERARGLLAREPKAGGSLGAWKWYRASAQACIEEAAVIYTEGLESLIKVPVRIDCRKQAGAPQFNCVLLTAPSRGAAQPSFPVGRQVVMETGSQRAAVQALLGGTERRLADAFAEGLCKLQRLGAFKQQPSLTLDPDTPAR